MKTITILIPIHNRILTTQVGIRALDAALNHYELNGGRFFRYLITIIDDGSTDGSFEWISENYPKIHLLKGDGNLWWTGVINLGAEYSLEKLGADYVLLWNDDIAPDIDFFGVAEKTLLKVDNNTVFGAKVIDINNKEKVLSCGGFFNKYNGVETLITSKNLRNYSASRYIQVDSLTGMGTFLHKDVIGSVGLWDSYLPHYKADSDYILTLKERGYRILVDQNLIIMDDSSKRGISKPKNFAEFWHNLSSVKSPYNLKFLTRYVKKHGITPFAFYGMFIEIVPIMLGAIKRTLFKS